MAESKKASQAPSPSPAEAGGKAPTSPPAASIPPVPLVANAIRPTTEVIHRGMHGAVLTVEEPAQGALSTVASRRWSELSMDIGLGTERPPKAHVGLDPSKRFLYMAPTAMDDPMGMEVRYQGNRATINLSKVFAPLDRYVQPGRREYYDVDLTPGKVQFDDGFESVSLYVYLTPTKTEPRRTMSDEAKAKLRATLAKKKQQKAQAGDQTAASEQ